ncbi:ATP-binding protein [Nocardioidaceae bacterium]|nr:ATP-binding protein [Nocardioidaceae bacterium]
MRTALTNPFTPGADTIPTIWAGRTRHVRDWQDVVRPRRLAGLPERGRTILGEAGVGKSALVRRIAELADADGDWVTPQLRMPTGSDPLKKLAAALLGLADRAGLASSREHRIGEMLARVRGVSGAGIGVELDRGSGPEPYVALTELLVEIGQRAIQHDVCVLIHLDEIQNVTDDDALSQLLICLGDALAFEADVSVPGGRVSRLLPIAVYLTGLPDFADMAGAKKGATFARRFATTTLAPIDDDDLRLALHDFVSTGWPVADSRGEVGRVRMEPAAVDLVIALCRGEPFLFQLVGDRAWYAGEEDVISAADVRSGWLQARPEAAAHVERILGRLPDREMQMLEAMATLPPEQRTATAIARAMDFASASQAGPTARRLDTVRGIIDRGKLHSFRHRAIEAYLTSDWPDVV